jgi:hypothetical protein
MACKRWNKTLDPEQANRNKEKWTNAEVEIKPIYNSYIFLIICCVVFEVDNITQLVPKYIRQRDQSVTVNWSDLSRDFNRRQQDCCNQWSIIQRSQMKRGDFSPQEDAIIRKRVKEWEGRGQGYGVR